MKPDHRLLLVVALFASLMGSAAFAHDGDEPLPVPEHREDAAAEDFAGVWEGAWDDTWYVRLTFTPIEDEADRVGVLYEWEENQGKPLRRREFVGELRDGVLYAMNDMLEVYLVPEQSDEAIAIGRFRHQRSADLTRQPAD
ncbi:MAG: hypothetical protein AAFY08_06515 [Planctomycetota bacterium]